MAMHRLRLLMLILLAAGALAAAPAGAVGVEVRPDRVLDGDTVTIAIADLPNGSVFTLRLDGEVAPNPDGTFAFTTTDLVMPFSLEKGQVQAALENTATNETGRAEGRYPGEDVGRVAERPVHGRAEPHDRGRHVQRASVSPGRPRPERPRCTPPSR